MKILITGGNGTMAQVIKKLLEENNYEVIAPPKEELDITNISQIELIMKTMQPDILINCAGYIVPSSIIEMEYIEFIKHLEVNLIGAAFCSKYAIINGCKTIINIGSTSAFEGRENWGAYCCSKVGIVSLTETLVREGYNCYSLNPARTATKMRERLFPSEDKSALMNPERVGEFVLKIIKGEFDNGSHIILTRDNVTVIPMRRCPK